MGSYRVSDQMSWFSGLVAAAGWGRSGDEEGGLTAGGTWPETGAWSGTPTRDGSGEFDGDADVGSDAPPSITP